MALREVEATAMRRAVELARNNEFHSGGNPRVGCVILSAEGEVIAEGWHAGAGTEHAEAVALRLAGSRAVGSTVVVTLEPCCHIGKTGPCALALAAAGVKRVVYSQRDLDPAAGGGAAKLIADGVDVEGPIADEDAASLNREWSVAVARGRPYVILKVAGTLDGRIAAADGSSRWVTGPEARLDGHETRAKVDAVMVGTGTVEVDDPVLTARPSGLPVNQPLRVVVGTRPIAPTSRVLDGSARSLRLATRDLRGALSELYRRHVRTVLVEGGKTLATALLVDGLVDRIDWYVAPVLLGESGLAAVGNLATGTIDEAERWRIASNVQLGADVRLRLVRRPPA